MNKIILSAFLMLSLAACGTSKTADVPAGGQQGTSPAKVATAKAILDKISTTKFKDGELLVRFKDGTSLAAIDKAHQTAGATIIKNLSTVNNLQHIKLPAGLAVQDAVTLYMADTNVDYAEPNYIRTVSQIPNDRYFTPQQWALQNTGTYANGTAGADIKAAGAWDISIGSRRVAVAVLDTGIDYTHPDLVGNMWADRVKVLLQDMHWLGQSTFKIVGEQVIYTDPFNIKNTDAADIILLSHDHPDHCSPADVSKVKGTKAIVVATVDCANRLRQDPLNPFTGDIRTVVPGSKLSIGGIDIEAVPAYNPNKPDHPKSKGWVGYVFTVNRNRDINTPTDVTNPVVDLKQETGPRIYFAGDTDRIPEMTSNSAIRGADVAILPVSGTDVMNTDEAKNAALDIRPKVAIPMHYLSTSNTGRTFADLLEGKVEVAVMADHSSGYTAVTVSYDNNKKIDDWRGWNFIDGNNDPWDNIGHGTHVAGIIGGTGNNGEGISGVNWRVELLPLKVCGSDGCPIAAVIDAIGYATFKGVKILNASLGGAGHSYAERDAILAARQAGVLLIAAAGNGATDSTRDAIGDNNDINPVYPAAYVLDNVIAVAATDQNDRRAAFSNFGLQTVHVGAPGTYILSTVPTTSTTVPSPFFWQNVNCTGTPFAGYNICDGTSMATPHVTGLAALLAHVYPYYSYSQIRGMIIKYVDKQPTLEGWIYSGGRINAARAVTSMLRPAGLTATAPLSSEITLSWGDNSGEDKYVIEKKQPNGSFLVIGETGQNVTTFIDGGLAASTSYTYRIKAVSSLPNPPNREQIMVESDYSEVTAATPAQTAASGSSGGGGCSIGRRQNFPTAVADSAVLLLPLIVIGLLRGLRRRK
ncbi:MAG: S8 family serine peptidase [Thermodesulfovibrionales bacterium]